jgi:hypothetical protein
MRPRLKTSCQAPGCTRIHRAKGYCTLHYQRWRKHGHVMDTRSPRPDHCQAPGCKSKRVAAHGLCPRHYQQLRRHGRLTPERENMKNGGPCQFRGCDRIAVCRGYCPRHYMTRYYPLHCARQEAAGAGG